MKPIPSKTSSAGNPAILQFKHRFGIWYGAALGLSFAIFAWGVDSFLLSRMNGLFPWLKFLGGVLPCVVLGGVVGWLAARLDRPLFAMLLWAGAASVFAWLTVNLPLQITPRILGLADPDIQNLLHYTYYESFSTRVSVAYIWIAIFVSLAGLLQIPLSDSAVFSTSSFGRIVPMLVTLVLMAICGVIVDGLNNEKLRGPVDAVNTAVQFAIENRGRELDPAESRRMRQGALRSVGELITPERRFIVSGYDQLLERVQVLARFEGAWVECDLIVNQLIKCEQVGNPR
jgi:hypothetical protein